MAINDQKHIEMSDQAITDQNANTPLNSKAKAEVEILEKANHGCNLGHLAQPLTFV